MTAPRCCTRGRPLPPRKDSPELKEEKREIMRKYRREGGARKRIQGSSNGRETRALSPPLSAPTALGSLTAVLGALPVVSSFVTILFYKVGSSLSLTSFACFPVLFLLSSLWMPQHIQGRRGPPPPAWKCSYLPEV